MVNGQYFTFDEFRRIMQPDGNYIRFDVPTHAQEKILKWIFRLNPIRASIGHPIIITSSFRPLWWEERQGRDGLSQHVYHEEGACDLRCKPTGSVANHNILQSALARQLMDSKDIGRIIFYSQPIDYNNDGIDDKYSFFHTDCKVLQEEPILMYNDGQDLFRIDSRNEFINIVSNKGRE